MTQLWTGFAVAEGVASGGSSAFNAAYFLARAFHERGSRRAAALLLVLLFTGVALEATALLLVADGALRADLAGSALAAPVSPWLVVLRAPLALASVLIGLVIAMGVQR